MGAMRWTRARNLFVSAVATFALQLAGAASMPAGVDGDPSALFENRVRPVLAAHCVKCHGADKQESGLRLDAGNLASKGGDRGPAIVSGDPEHSLIVAAIRRTGELKMPPDESLRPEEVAGVVDWIRHGAPGRRKRRSLRFATVRLPTKTGNSGRSYRWSSECRRLLSGIPRGRSRPWIDSSWLDSKQNPSSRPLERISGR